MAKKGYAGVWKEAETSINNASLRSNRTYTKKGKGTFRIVCLGNSFSFGEAGPERDRYCDQMEEFYSKHEITVSGKPIETYAVGLSSWTTVQEAAYLTSRISEYEPDIILMLPIPNDITDIAGVTGGGVVTGTFSPGHRDWGSGVFSSEAGSRFGLKRYTAFFSDLSEEGRNRWRKAMKKIKRLEEVQSRRGEKCY